MLLCLYELNATGGTQLVLGKVWNLDAFRDSKDPEYNTLLELYVIRRFVDFIHQNPINWNRVVYRNVTIWPVVWLEKKTPRVTGHPKCILWISAQETYSDEGQIDDDEVLAMAKELAVTRYDPNTEAFQMRAQWKKVENCKMQWAERWSWLLDERKQVYFIPKLK